MSARHDERRNVGHPGEWSTGNDERGVMNVESASRRRVELREKYLSLGSGEWMSVASFSIAGILGTQRLGSTSDTALAIWAGLAPLLVILMQAGTYWLLARSWVGGGRMPAQLARTFRGFRIVDAVLLVIGLIGVMIWWPSNVMAAILAVAAWIFGVIEYLNYFVVRLSYPPLSWFQRVREARRPQLMQDVANAA